MVLFRNDVILISSVYILVIWITGQNHSFITGIMMIILEAYCARNQKLRHAKRNSKLRLKDLCAFVSAMIESQQRTSRDAKGN